MDADASFALTRSRDTPATVRQAARDGRLRGQTSGLARGFVQANLAILPGDLAADFLRFCQRNPKPCPLLDVTEAGSPEPRNVAPGADLRTELPKYEVFGSKRAERRTVATSG